MPYDCGGDSLRAGDTLQELAMALRRLSRHE